MEHVVFFTSPDSSPAFRRLEGLDEALVVAEHLRNEMGVTDAAIHALTPVPVSFRPYYRVEVIGPQAVAPAAADGPPLMPPPSAFEPAEAALEPLPVGRVEIQDAGAGEPVQDEPGLVADVTMQSSAPDADLALPPEPGPPSQYVPPARVFEDAERRELGFFTR